MNIEKIKKRLWLRIIPGIRLGAYRITQSRPVLDVDDTLYKYDEVYEVTLQDSDTDVFCKTANYVYGEEFCHDLSEKEDSGFYKKTLFSCAGSGGYTNPLLINHKTVFTSKFIVVCKEDGERITKLTGRDSTSITRQKTLSSNKKIIGTFFFDNLQALCKEYGIICTHKESMSFSFQTKESMNRFIINQVKETLGPRLKELGISVAEPYSSVRHIKSHTLDRSDIIFNALNMSLDESLIAELEEK
jgi:hypothetical protein